MGERNLVAARQALSSHSVPLVGEAVGGDYGRTVRFRVRDGRVQVSTVAHGIQHL
jgi:chemotaxis protein CheD